MSMRSDEPVQLEVELDRKVLNYQAMLAMLYTAVTVVFIPFIPFVWLFAVLWYNPRFMAHHSMKLSDREVQIRRGVVFRSETRMTLDRVTDVSVHQGPLMRRYGIYGVTVETAGQTQAEGTANLIGVKDPYGFRDAVLHNAELYKQGESAPAPTGPGTLSNVSVRTGASGGEVELLTEIRDILARMEQKS